MMNVFSFNINPIINPIFLYIQLIEDRPIVLHYYFKHYTNILFSNI